MLPPPRKVKPSVALKNIHSEQVSKLQTKHQQECDLLEDLRTYCQKRSVLEKEYAQGLLKLTNQLLKREFPTQPDVSSDDGREHKKWFPYCDRTACTVWHNILEETEKIAKARLQAAEMYMERIAEPVKPLRTSKMQCMKKVMPQLTTIQSELSNTVLELTKSQKTYNTEESLAHEARQKSSDADDKLKRKSTGIFKSMAGLQKNSAKLKTRRDACEVRSTACRNEYILNMSAANAHQIRYYSTDLPELLQVLDGEVYEKIEEYFKLIGQTAADISQSETDSFRNIVTQAEKICRQYSLQCFLYQHPVFTDLIQYQFEACHQDPICKLSADYNAAPDLDKESKKWATKVAKETKLIREYNRLLKAYQCGGSIERLTEPGDGGTTPTQDPEQKMEELRQNIRKAETSKVKAEGRLEALRAVGMNIDEYLNNAQMESLGTEDLTIARVPSQMSLRTESSGGHSADEPTYTHYDDDDDFIDDTFNTSAENETFFTHSSGKQFPVKCRSLYAFEATNLDELTIQANEELDLIANGDGDGWVKARNLRGKTGYIPENYVNLNDSIIADNQTPSEPATPVAMQPPEIQSPIATDIQHETTSSYSSGDLEIQQTTDVMPVDNFHLPLQESYLQDVWARALYDYTGSTAEELQFNEGALIKILRKDHGVDDGFWEGEINGRVGLFPSLVVEEITQEGMSLEDPFSPLLTSPPDFAPPPPVMVTLPTPDELPPPVSNGDDTGVRQQAVPPEQFFKKVRFCENHIISSAFHVQSNYLMMADYYDSEGGEESLV
ncbi:hypothetical protein SNE40_016202 [Patella caerulea]|uniref:Uncharacterized protein n=1 Tax=Patella caerulea TaxID=87958 RepID=A0AAN8PCU4_PATCE